MRIDKPHAIFQPCTKCRGRDILDQRAPYHQRTLVCVYVCVCVCVCVCVWKGLQDWCDRFDTYMLGLSFSVISIHHFASI